MKIDVAIWGAGFVGGSCYRAFSQSDKYKVGIFDVSPKNSKLYVETEGKANFVNKETAKQADLHLVCVPTPMKANGECDISIVESVVREIASETKDCEIVIKSTVSVGACQYLADKYAVKILFNPEFLTEANAYEDFITLPYQIFGFTKEYNSTQTKLSSLYSSCPQFPKHQFIYLDSKQAEMVKLMRNCYLATRLSFFNEMKQYCKALKMDDSFEKICDIAGMDKRVGDHYNKVHEGTFGGHCLPKDLNNVIFSMISVGQFPHVLQGVWSRNLESNTVRDWEKMVGRAVSKKEDDTK